MGAFTDLIIAFMAAHHRESGKPKMAELVGGADETEQVLRHPVAATLVLSILLSVIFYPNAPLALYRLPLFLMMFPLLRVVSKVLSRDERIMSYYLAGLFLMRHLNALFVWNDLVHRILILFMAGLALFGAVWSVRVDLIASGGAIGHWRKARMQLMHIGGVILLGSLIANIAGCVTLATLTADACISSAYAGAAIFAAVLALEGFLFPIFYSPLARRSAAISQHGESFERHGSSLIRLAAVVTWVWVSLTMVGLSAPMASFVSSVLARQWAFGGIAFSFGGILLFVATVWISALAARFLAFIVETDILSRMKLPQGMAATVSMLLRDFIIAFGFVLALAGAGVQWSQMVLIASAIGVGIGLGLQNLVASFIAGIILIVERPIRVGTFGDWHDDGCRVAHRIAFEHNSDLRRLRGHLSEQ